MAGEDDDIVKLETFADPQAVPTYQGQWQGVVDTLDKVEAGLIRLAALNGKTINRTDLPKTKKELDDLNEAIKKVETAETSLNQIQRTRIEVQVRANAETAAYRQQIKDTIAVQNSATDSIAAMRIQLKLLNDEYNKGDAAIRGKLVPQINALKSKLNETQHAIGNYQDQVGNYAIGLGKYGKALMPLTHVIRGIAAAFGVHLEGLREYASAIHGADHLTEMATEGMHEHAAATTESTVANEANTASTVESAAATEGLAASEAQAGESALAMAAPIGIAVAAIALLAGATYEYFKIAGPSKELLKETAEQAKLLGDAYKKANEALQDLNETTAGKKQKANETIAEKRSEAYEAYRKVIEDLGIRFDDEDSKQQIQSNQKALQAQQEYYATLEALDMEAKAKSQKIDDDANKKALKQVDQFQKEIEILKDEFIQDELKRAIAKLETERKYAILEEEQSEDAEDDKRFKIAEINQIYDLKEELERQKIADKIDKEREKDLKQYEKYLDELRKRYDKWLKDQEQAFNSQTKLKESLGVEESANRTGAAQNKVSADKNKQAADNDIIKTSGKQDSDKQLADARQLLQDEMDLEDRMADERKQKLEKDREKQVAEAKGNKMLILEIDADYANQVKNIDDDIANKKAALRQKEFDDEKKILAERLKEVEKNEEAVLQVAKEGVKEKSDLKESGLKTDQEMLASEAQVEATLAAAGKRNSLDAVQAAEAKNAEQQKQEQRKEHQAQEALDLATTFEKALNSNLQQNMPEDKAIAKALETVFLAKGIAAGFTAAAGFATGVENLQGPGTGTSDSIPVWLSKGESVAKADATAQHPGLVTAMNEGRVEDWFKANYLTKLNINNGNSDMAMLLDEVKQIVPGFKKALSEQPRKIAYQVGDKTIIEESRNGLNKRDIIEAPRFVPVSRK